MYINEVRNSGGVEPTGVPVPRQVDADREKPQRPGSIKSPTDRTELTEANREESRTQQAARLVLETIPDVRLGEVELARQRLESGFYDKPAVRDEIAGRMIADPEANPASGGVSEEEAAKISHNIQSGYYDKPDVKDTVANGMIDDALEGMEDED